MPRKSNVSVTAKAAAEPVAVDTETTMDNDDSIVQPGGTSTPKEKSSRKSKGGEDETGIEELMMPRTMVSRLAKGTIPPNFILSKDAITAISKSATIFISHINAAAHEHTVEGKRVTVSPEDVFKALRDTEYGWMEERLREEYELHKSSQTAKRNEYRAKMKQNRDGAKDIDGEIENGGEGDGENIEEADVANESTILRDEVEEIEEQEEQDEEMEDEVERVSKRPKIDVKVDRRTSGRQRKSSQKARQIEEESMLINSRNNKVDDEDADEPEEEFQDAPEEISSEEEDDEQEESQDEEEEDPDQVERDEHDSAEESEGEQSD